MAKRSVSEYPLRPIIHSRIIGLKINASRSDVLVTELALYHVQSGSRFQEVMSTGVTQRVNALVQA